MVLLPSYLICVFCWVGLLRSQKIWTRTKLVGAAGQAQKIRPDGEAEVGRGIEYAALCCISNSIAELREPETDCVSKCSGVESTPRGVHRRVVHIGKGLKAVGDKTLRAVVLLVRKAVKRL